MKKSDAAKQLIEILHESLIISEVISQAQAELILSRIEEEIGMLPPGYVDDTMWLRSNQDYAVCNEWEEE